MERAIINALKKYKKFAVTMHVNPDADAVAAALAMTLFLKCRGKDVRLYNQDECPRWLGFVPQIKLYRKFDEQDVFRPEIVVVLDAGEIDRIGRVQALVTPGVKVINIDHHVTNTRFGDWNLVHPEWSSTSEILYGFLKRAGCRLTKDIAVLLYLGIMTDTGSFGFDSTTAHTHRIVAELLRFKFSVSDLYRQVYETTPRHDLQAFFSLMNRMELFFDGKVACLTITKRDLASFSGDFDLKDKIFTFLRSVKGLEVIVILAEQDKATTRLNFRSRGDVDVAALASKFGGGGHKKASGGMISADLVRAKKTVLAVIRKAL